VKIAAVYLLETVEPWTVLAMKASFFEFSGPKIPNNYSRKSSEVTDVHALISF
jgi:hypothetical protein